MLMMNKKLLFSLLFCCVTTGLLLANKSEFTKAEHYFNHGEYSELKHFSDSIRRANPTNEDASKIDSLCEIASRIQLDFSLSEPKTEAQIRTKIGNFTLNDKKLWEENNWLECKIIDGQKRYFNRAVSNLKLRLNQYNDSANHRPAPIDSLTAFRLRHTAHAIAQTTQPGSLSSPVHYTLTYTVSVKPDVVPAGETLRCWLPFPKENRTRQSNVLLLEASKKDYKIAPDSCGHRSIYMEKKAVANKPTEFRIKVSYTGSAQYFDLNKTRIAPYKKKSELYKKYTEQQGKHILFTAHIKSLADKIVGKEKRPEKIVQKLYEWIDGHIIWSGALEYSTMDNIPEYVLEHRRGDCGMQTLLFMTMARYKGIPVKWQSGWMLHPNEVNLHDWCEVYYEGVGWVPLDMSFGLQPSHNHSVRYFYMSGMDAYRLIVNDEISAPFNPGKKFMRSEPVDFQRGEVEWNGGNLYFDKWDYHMDVDYQ
ncbi:transglutaminase-like enzyme [Paludibacter jiangxiensis]|uniref:Transglutaminase-like enzyme n=2 Tax=Paludibacter jiangxiensis TaxID=681398 RepID=A0A170Y6H7_9BACT|nr:transglutaminase-like enzyme [Paludibacter jiangxiensis]